MQLTSARYTSSSSGIGLSGREGSPGMAILGNNSCRPVTSRYGATPVILLAVIHSKSSAGLSGSSKKLRGSW